MIFSLKMRSNLTCPLFLFFNPVTILSQTFFFFRVLPKISEKSLACLKSSMAISSEWKASGVEEESLGDKAHDLGAGRETPGGQTGSGTLRMDSMTQSQSLVERGGAEPLSRFSWSYHYANLARHMALPGLSFLFCKLRE